MNKIAIVTGASYGIGRETAKILANSGYDVLAVARSLDLLKELEKENKNIKAYQLDITDYKAIKEFEFYLKDKEIEILINNAGGGANPVDNFLNDYVENWKNSYNTNVIGAMELSRIVVPYMIKNKKGHIVFISSVAGRFVYKNGGGYNISKHGTVALSKLLRLELFGKNIRVTEIAPGNVNSRGDRSNLDCLDPKDVAESIKWVISLPDHINIDSLSILHINNLQS
jgi:NADP-dependent 3-hydroxy acid dehydrogenase YdfG